eukprot:2284807-Alexandrium_andersonii.AAC.1
MPNAQQIHNTPQARAEASITEHARHLHTPVDDRLLYTQAQEMKAERCRAYRMNAGDNRLNAG